MKDVIRNFAVFEGVDGSGTTTQLSLLKDRLLNAGLDEGKFFLTCEPAQNPVGSLIRSALKKNIELRPETLARLFAAAVWKKSGACFTWPLREHVTNCT